NRALLHGVPNARSRGALDLVSKYVVPNAHIISAPVDDTGPGQIVEERARGATPPSPGDPSSDNTGEGTQETMESITAARAQQKVQMRAHVGKVVDTYAESTRHVAERAANRH